MYTLSNGGFYVAPENFKEETIQVETVRFKYELTADGFGITVCLLTYQLMHILTEENLYDSLFRKLEQFYFDASPDWRVINEIVDRLT